MTEEVQVDSTPPVESQAVTPVPGDAKDVQGSESSTEQREDAPAQAEGEQPEKKSSGGFQKRIEKLVAQRHELEQRLQEREQQLAMVAAAQQQRQQAPEEPRPEQFEDYASYVKAQAEYAAMQTIQRTLAAQAQQQRMAAEQAQARQRAIEHATRIEQARTKYADFDQVLEQATASPTMLEYLSSIPDGPDIAYYLGRNPAESQRIASLPERAQAIELGRIAARVESQQRQQVSSAPKPIAPVKPTGAAERDPSRMSIDEWMAARTAKLRKR